MSLNSALLNAFSGLRANARSASLVSTNIANATTEGYGRRTLELSPSVRGTVGGVTIDGVLRHSDPALLADRQLSDAASGYNGSIHDFTVNYERSVGSSEDPGSLTDRLVGFENALLTAAANPASAQRLESVATSADALADKLNSMTSDLQDARLEADRNIGIQVDQLNAAIQRLDDLNGIIKKAWPNNDDIATVLDERQKLLDSISGIVPLRVVDRDRGEIAIFSTSGAVLLDGSPQEVGFQRVYAIDANITYDAGLLSGLTLNGNVIDPSNSGMFSGGSLAAQFEIRDNLAVTRQAELDGIARDLIERLGPGGPDTTLAATDPGLFTDEGLVFDPTTETGLAGRIALNTLVAPGSGGTWRLRDGLGAVAQGPVGDATILQGITDALNSSTLPSSTALAPVSKSFIAHVTDYSSNVASARVFAENEQVFSANRNTVLRELEFAKGVDTDQELQNLMLIEQHYTANAKVMQTVDELMERLLSI